MILNKNEQLNNENFTHYVHFLRQTMTYFGDMKVAQLQRRAQGDKHWEKHFLDRVTWRNLRGGLCPFLYFAGYTKSCRMRLKGLTLYQCSLAPNPHWRGNSAQFEHLDMTLRQRMLEKSRTNANDKPPRPNEIVVHIPQTIAQMKWIHSPLLELKCSPSMASNLMQS